MGRGGSFRGGGGGGKSSGSSKSSVYVSPGSNIKAAAAASGSKGFTGGSGQSHVEEDVSPTKDYYGKCYSYLRAYNHCIKYEDPMCWLWENNYKDHCGGIAPIVDPKLAEPTSEYDRGGSVWC